MNDKFSENVSKVKFLKKMIFVMFTVSAITLADIFVTYAIIRCEY